MTFKAELHNRISSTIAGAFIEGYEKGITETKNNILKYIEIIEKEEKSPMIMLKRIKRSLK